VARRMAARRGEGRRAAPAARPWWGLLSDDELLDVRLCDLGLTLAETPLERRLERLQRELERRGLLLRPHAWLSTEWFSPSGVAGFAIPFYLAHPRLRRLEERQMLDVEGGSEAACMQLMRHETGHVVDTAYRLHFKKSWRKVFGRFGDPYAPVYRPIPHSRRFVQHLEHWYAQSHPAEDFAETFAVWLRPRSGWRKRYRGWPALAKLEYVDELMSSLAGVRPAPLVRERTEALSTLRQTLREHYAAKRARHAGRSPVFDRGLLALFAPASPGERRRSAAAWLRRHQPYIRSEIARRSGEYPYAADQVLREMIGRCRRLALVVEPGRPAARLEQAVRTATHILAQLHAAEHSVRR
jgi:hypothetical protein